MTSASLRDRVLSPSATEPEVSAHSGNAPLRVLSLFAGIGGFDLGLERTGGFKTVAFCEIEPFAVRVLNKHWPKVPVYGDVRELTAGRLRADGIVPNVIVGGFPCQDISLAGKGAGLAGKRSGLWSHYARLIGEIGPCFVIVENVSALLGRGLGDVLGDLAALGYDAEWHCIPAAALGAPHRRDRVWIVAYPNTTERGEVCGSLRRVAGTFGIPQGEEGSGGPSTSGEALAYATGERRREARQLRRDESAEWTSGRREAVPDTYGPRLSLSWSQSLGEDWEQGGGLLAASRWWRVEPAVGRVAHGVPDRVGQLRAYGNAVVPQIPELIGRAILAAIADTHAKRGDVKQAPSLMSGGGAKQSPGTRP